MRRMLALLPIFALVLAGCSDISNPAPTALQPKEVADPSMKISSVLYLSPPGSETNKLRVGDPASIVAQTFPEPKSAFITRTLPPGFASHYSAWDYSSTDLSFGVIYFPVPDENGSGYHDAVALAMTREDGLTNDVVLSTEQQYAADFGPPSTVIGKLVRYWFWSDPDSSQSFMLCAVVSKDSKKADHFQLTAALGDDVVMKYLHMDIADAKVDGKVLEKSPLKFTFVPPMPPAKETDADTGAGRISSVRVPPKQALAPTSANATDKTGATSGGTATTTGGTGSSETTQGTPGSAPAGNGTGQTNSGTTGEAPGETGASQTTSGTTGAAPSTGSSPADNTKPPTSPSGN